MSESREPTKSRRRAVPDAWAGSVALLMDGGTASVYASRAWDAYHEFAQAGAAFEAAG